jgi:MFS family permease
VYGSKKRGVTLLVGSVLWIAGMFFTTFAHTVSDSFTVIIWSQSLLVGAGSSILFWKAVMDLAGDEGGRQPSLVAGSLATIVFTAITESFSLELVKDLDKFQIAYVSVSTVCGFVLLVISVLYILADLMRHTKKNDDKNYIRMESFVMSKDTSTNPLFFIAVFLCFACAWVPTSTLGYFMKEGSLIKGTNGSSINYNLTMLNDGNGTNPREIKDAFYMLATGTVIGRITAWVLIMMSGKMFNVDFIFCLFSGLMTIFFFSLLGVKDLPGILALSFFFGMASGGMFSTVIERICKKDENLLGISNIAMALGSFLSISVSVNIYERSILKTNGLYWMTVYLGVVQLLGFIFALLFAIFSSSLWETNEFFKDKKNTAQKGIDIFVNTVKKVVKPAF